MRIRIDPLDRLVSEYVRRRADGYCERCGTYHGWKGLQASHFIGRSNHSVRYDECNLVALCFGCHQYFHSNPHEHQAWFLQHLGQEAYDMLQARRRQGAKPDRNALGIYYKCQLHALNSGGLFTTKEGINDRL